MQMMTPEEFDALTRIDFQVFVERVFLELNPATPYKDNFHIGVLCQKLEAMRRGEIKRLIINVPPRSLKSIIASVAFPAFVLGHDPTQKIVAASYGQDLSEAMARDCRQVMLSAWYQRLFPQARLSPDRRAVHDYEMTMTGGRLATSIGGAITGLGGNFIIVDDPTKPEEALSDTEREKANQWYNHTLTQRLNDKMGGAILVVMQRLHPNDFVGHITQFEDWEVLSFPAIAQEDEVHRVVTPHGAYTHHRAAGDALHPSREPLSVLEHQRKVQGTVHFAAQYLQCPIPPGGWMVKEHWFPRFDADNPPAFEKIVQSWDTANKVKHLSDYSVCVTMGIKGQHRYILNVFRKRLEYPDLKRAVRHLANFHGARQVLIEDRVSGVQLIQELRMEGLPGLIAVSPKGDKTMRMLEQTPQIEGGLVHLPERAPWLDDFLNELMLFPKSPNDDQVDALAQALKYCVRGNAADMFLAALRMRDEERDAPPSIRVRHAVHYSMRFQTQAGRNPRPFGDGSFLVTPAEFNNEMRRNGFVEYSPEEL